MKRYGHLYEQVCAFENIESAYRKARRNKRYRNEVLRFSARKEDQLLSIQNSLVDKTYQQGEYRIFTVAEPKTRSISALSFRDRVMHHAVNNVLEPLLGKRFYHHSYACRKGRGMHAASNTLSNWIRNLSYTDQKLYALKCDIYHYFQSVNHERLKNELNKVIKDADMMCLLEKIIASNGGDTGIPHWQFVTAVICQFLPRRFG